MSNATELAPRQQDLQNVEPPAQDAALMHIIERASLDPNMDIAKLEKLLELKERWDQKQAKLLFDEAMATVQGKIQPVVADADNQQTNSRYARLVTIVKALSPIYTAEGFSVSYGTEDCPSERLATAGYFRTTSELTHIGGYTKHYHVDLPMDTMGPKGQVNKTPIHGTKSAISYARGILMGLMFNFTTSLDVDDDGNGAGALPITDEQAAKIREHIEALEIDEPGFLKYLDVKSVDDIPASKHAAALKAIERKRKAVGK